MFAIVSLVANAQYYINTTTDASLGNKPLTHTTELKIGMSSFVSERQIFWEEVNGQIKPYFSYPKKGRQTIILRKPLQTMQKDKKIV